MNIYSGEKEVVCSRHKLDAEHRPTYYDIEPPAGQGWYLTDLQIDTNQGGSKTGSIVAIWIRDKDCKDLDNITNTPLEGK